MPVCHRCQRTRPTAELRRRRAPHEGEFVCKPAYPGGPQCQLAFVGGRRVDTPLGPGRIMNVARTQGVVTTVLVLLDADREARGNVSPEAVWRAVKPEEVRT